MSEQERAGKTEKVLREGGAEGGGRRGHLDLLGSEVSPARSGNAVSPKSGQAEESRTEREARTPARCERPRASLERSQHIFIQTAASED